MVSIIEVLRFDARDGAWGGTVRGGGRGFSDGCGMAAARRAQAFGRESAESSLCIFLWGFY